MSAAYPLESDSARAVSGAATRLNRIAGVAGLAFAVVVGTVNIAAGATSPPGFDAEASEIVTFFSDHRTILVTLGGLVPVGVVALFIFIASAYGRFSHASSEAAFWTRVGAIGIVIVEVMFLTRMLFEFVLIANIETLAAEPALVTTLWQLQSTAMILNGLALAVALLGLSRAGRLSGLLPAWQEIMGLAAALAFLIASVVAIPSLEGSPVGLLGLPAFLAWLLWLTLTGIRLLRADDAVA